MQQTKELNALFTLIDDPDQEVYTTVSDKIVEFGKGIIPNLENLWENTLSESIQERIELLIHRLHYTDLTNDLIEWRDSAYHDLLFGALLVAKYQYPDLHSTPVLQEIEKIRRNVWLELNSFLTPLEQANVLSSILYNYYNLKGVEVNYNNPDDFFIQKVVETKKGNAISNGIIYQVMCDLLDINAKIINIPKQVIIAFYHSDYDAANHKGHPQEKIHFYVDAVNGHAYSHNDIEAYFKRVSVPSTPSYYKPISHKRTIQIMLEEVSKCFTLPSNQYKQTELLALADLLDN
ncbi:MAG: transglutaminase family protein [Bacteroidetes bacterium]|nr:transglutaminase family protein [Bacteroidota bacterium]MBS1669861.1 transglutaminase family protein [Bacteroidota bacterium]